MSEKIKLPPFSPESESGVLGAIILCPENLNECQAKFKTSEVFFDLKNRLIYEVLCEMAEAQKPIDAMTLKTALALRGKLSEVGGFSFIIELTDSAGNAGHLGSYADTVLEKHTLRKMIRVCSETIARIYDNEQYPDRLLDQLETDALSVRENLPSEGETAKTLVDKSIIILEEMFNKKGAIGGLPTGLSDVDKMTDGLHGGEMVVIAALPGCGKSALAMNMAVHNSILGIPVGIFSLEMKPVRLMVRSICAHANVNSYAFQNGTATEGDFDRLTKASAKLSSSALHIENANGWTIGQIQAKARRMKQQHGIKMIVVDYIQLISAVADSREQEVSKISKGLKKMAMELDCPVIALSQLNDDGKLRESRAIGQDADSVWKIAWDEVESMPKNQPVSLRIIKNREGGTGTVKLLFRKDITKFECVPKVDGSDYQNPHKD